MKITELSVGLPRPVEYRGKMLNSGIFKTPVAGPVKLSFDNLDGDRQADLTVHGGRDKAVYVYPQKHYAYWAEQAGVEKLESSQFGENLTVSGMTEQDIVIGARYRLGSAIVVVTQPRLPCFKLGIRVGDNRFPAKFLASGKLGFYLRVEEEGVVQADDAFHLIDLPDHGMTVHDLWSLVFRDTGNKRAAQSALQRLPHIDAGWIRRLRAIQKRLPVRPTG